MKTILIVDDDPTTLTLLDKVISKMGHGVVKAIDGHDALDKIKQYKIDLIVLDVMMPQVNGYDVCREIKFDPDYKHIPILLFTARGQELDNRLGQLMGIDYLQKPLDHQVFQQTIERIFIQ